MRAGRSGAELHRLVAEYADLGDHRTATTVDEETRDWFVSALGSDLDVRRVPYEIGRFDCESVLMVGGEQVEHLPLFYEAVGGVETQPEIVELDCISNFAVVGLDDAIASAMQAGAAALVVVQHTGHGRLVALNREPTVRSGLPTVLVGRHAGERLAGNDVDLSYASRLATASSETIVGLAGGVGPEVVLTTPLSGWFRCGGERGPGVALAIDLAARLAEVARVTLLVSTGHELAHAGPRAYFAGEGAGLRPDAVIHLGASIATGPATEGFAGSTVQTSAPPSLDAAVEAIFTGDTSFAGRPEQWISEAKEWIDRADVVFSLTGIFERFHTPDDDATSTTPEALQAASREIDLAIDAVVAHRSRG